MAFSRVFSCSNTPAMKRITVVISQLKWFNETICSGSFQTLRIKSVVWYCRPLTKLVRLFLREVWFGKKMRCLREPAWPPPGWEESCGAVPAVSAGGVESPAAPGTDHNHTQYYSTYVKKTRNVALTEYWYTKEIFSPLTIFIFYSTRYPSWYDNSLWIARDRYLLMHEN